MVGLIDDTFALFVPRGRSINGLIPNVVLRETANDTLRITEHPVETGAAISDHRYKQPATLEMECGWSDSTAGYSGYIDDIYQSLLAQQADPEPFDLITGKRRYSNMMIENLSQITDPKSENTLMVVCSFKQVLLTSTSGSGSYQTGNMAEPQKTGEVKDSGTKTPVAAPGGANIPVRTVLV